MLAMAATPLHIPTKCFSSQFKARHQPPTLPVRRRLIARASRDESSSSGNTSSPSSAEQSSNNREPATPPEPLDPRMLPVEAKFTSRRRRKKEEPKSKSLWPEREIKPWDKMSLKEKAWEVYTGDKGILFWLNKAAWFTIIGVAGAWIVFRFLGPALGLYQLENELLAPEKVFSGS